MENEMDTVFGGRGGWGDGWEDQRRKMRWKLWLRELEMWGGSLGIKNIRNAFIGIVAFF